MCCSIRKLQELGVTIDICHYRLYSGYLNTENLVGDYLDCPRRIDMHEVCAVMLSKFAANEHGFPPKTMLSRGGLTHLVARDSVTGDILEEQSAICSLNDTYNKKIGIEIAAGRLYDKLQKSRLLEWKTNETAELFV